MDNFNQEQVNEEFGCYPITKELFADQITPIELLRKLKKISNKFFIYESVENQERWGRYTFLGYNPTLNITCDNGVIRIYDEKGKLTKEINDKKPDEVIDDLLKKYMSPKVDGLPPFTGGLVGYFSYDYMKYFEDKLRAVMATSNDDEMFDMNLMLFDTIIAFDNMKQKIFLITNVSTNASSSELEIARQKLVELENLIRFGEKQDLSNGYLKSEFQVKHSKEKYCEMVEKAKRYIYEGDIFQVVLSNSFSAKYEGDLLEVYRQLRISNPSPYMFYIVNEDFEVTGASPETLVKLENQTLYTYPLAGTRKRGATIEEDMANEKELLEDEKELAEHNMLVDLGRNDLGKISKFNTVKVEKYMAIEKYSHVMHIASTIKGEIKDGLSAINAVNAVLPAGTLSGAPKVRACEIINELEGDKRGIYGGAVGYLDFSNNLDTCIAIRMAYKNKDKVVVRSGAGIVADSVPELEFEECCNKAKAMLNAFNMGGK